MYSVIRERVRDGREWKLVVVAKFPRNTTFCKLCSAVSASDYETSGGASAVKEPGHFEVRKSSSQVTRMHFFLQKS